MKAAFLAAVLTAAVLTPVQPAAAAPLAFAHPGVLVSRAQLDIMRQKVNEGAQPWATAYDAMRSSNFAALSWTPKPRAIVECGPSSNPNLGCSDERNDAVAAYTHALMWYVTRDTRHAQKSAQIMDAWSAVIKDHTNHNARLQTGWAGASWTRAAELIRHTSSVWPADRVNRFATMLRDVYLPEIRDGSPNTNGNWELIMMAAMIGIGVFNNDTATFNKAISIWRGRVPAYVYLRTDGQYPKSPPGSNKDTPAELIDYWQDQSTFVDGLAQETCRDFGHTGWGFEAAAHVAETAWHQGIDLYSEMRERMTKALEFHANYELGASVPSWLCGGSLDTGLGATGEVAHNHYRNRTDTRLPKTLQVIQSRRPMGVSHFIAWETLTHATNPGVATTAAPARVITVSSISQLQSAADQAQPGDRIELVDGAYTTSAPITLRRSGSSTEPITIAAQRVGGAEIRGSAGFSFAGVDNVVVSGFRLTHGGSISIPADSQHVRFSRNVVRLTSGGNWMTVVGNDVEVDRNTFQNKSNQGVFLQISGPGDSGMAQRTWVHHNYFADHTFAGENGGESIRLGLSFRQLSSARATVEYNLFERTDGDSEAISVKSADNTIRFNTLRDSRGSIVLRHGNRNLVDGNLMLGNTAGIRFYDNDHVIINNVLQGGTGQIIAGSGTIADDNTGSTAHARPDRVVVAFNTVAGNRTNLLQVGQGTDRLGPNDCTFANNIFVGGGSGALLDIDEATGARWQGNIVWAGTGGNAPSSGYRVVNPGLVTDSGGLRRLAAGSPAIDSAAGSFSQVTHDLDLQKRTGAKDVGADEFLAGGSQRRPLTTADVGPNS